MPTFNAKVLRSLFSLFLCCAAGRLTAQEPAAPGASPLPATQAPAPTPASETPVVKLENSVVHIFATVSRPDIMKPWTKGSPQEQTGSGVVIEGKRILTNAHVVLFAKDLQVQGNESGDKFNATIEYCSPHMDLAVLKLEDESFFDTRPAVERSSVLPSLKDSVMAYGYPTGGNTLSITKGIVSRIEFTGYTYPVSALRIQIDAAINPGNSGGPAIAGDKMVGLAFSTLSNAQSIGYIIPNEEIELFLKDVADGTVDGKPGFYEPYQTSENPALRAFLKIPLSEEGVLFTTHESGVESPLEPWDLITHIGDSKIDNQGMIKLPNGLTLSLRYLVQQVAKDGKCLFRVIRKGKPVILEVPVPNRPVDLFPSRLGEYPRYFICGPIVFCAADFFTLTSMVGNNGGVAQTLAYIGNPVVTRRGDSRAFADEELVFVPSPFFPHKLSKGYGSPLGRVIESVNGVHVKNLRHLVELLRDAREDFLVLKFSGKGETLVFNRKDFIGATEQILSDNNVREQGTAELMTIWRAVP